MLYTQNISDVSTHITQKINRKEREITSLQQDKFNEERYNLYAEAMLIKINKRKTHNNLNHTSFRIRTDNSEEKHVLNLCLVWLFNYFKS